MSERSGVRRRRRPVTAARLALAACLSVASAARGQPAPLPPTATSTPPRLEVKRHRLENGLRVVMLVDHTRPTVALEVLYDVGARNEERGRTGFAHLFEHMMFQGSRNVARGQHSALVSARGGRDDARTSADGTRYFDVLPAGELALGLWLEADRMKWLDVSRQSFENQRSVVKDERLRFESAPHAGARRRLSELVFQGYWPYEHAGPGTERDLEAARLEWVERFHETHYAPNNAVLAIAGDLDEAEALSLVKQYFGDARAQPMVARHEPPAVPQQSAPRTSVVEDPHATLPALLLGWQIPPAHEVDHYALQLAARLLGTGDSSRLGRSLVRERDVAVAARASTGGHRGPDIFTVDVDLARGGRIAPAVKLIESQLAEVARGGPTDEEMRKLRNAVRAELLFALESNPGRAERLARMELERGDAGLALTELDRYLAVTKDDIRRVVATYLTAARRSTVEVKPGDGT